MILLLSYPCLNYKKIEVFYMEDKDFRGEHLHPAGCFCKTKIMSRSSMAIFCVLISLNLMSSPVDLGTLTLTNPEEVGMSSSVISDIDLAIDKQINDGELQGAVVAVSRYGKPIYFSARGFSNLGTKQPMKRDALFHMASSTKPVLGVAAMIAIERGLIKPDDPVERYIPKFKDIRVAVLETPSNRDISPIMVWDTSQKDGEKTGALSRFFGKIYSYFTDVYFFVPPYRTVPVHRPVTIHDLLTHTAGLGTFGLGSAVADWNQIIQDENAKQKLSEETLGSFIDKVAAGPLDFQPGARWMYSGTIGLDVVARIIEITSGQPFNEFVQDNIFDPLDMEDTFWNIPASKYPRLVTVLNDKGGWNKTNTSYFSGSIGLVSTAGDYLNFEQMLVNKGTFNGHRILEESSVELMSANHAGDLYGESSGGKAAGEGFGYTVSIILDPEIASVPKSKGAFGWAGAAGTISWTEPQTQIAVVIMVQQPNWELNKEISTAINASLIDGV